MLSSIEILWVFVGVNIFLISLYIIVYKIYNKTKEEFIKSIKPGDIFVFTSKVNWYYNKIEEYKHDLENPFDSNPPRLFFPDSTCIIKGVKKSKTGELWVCYCLIDSPDDIIVAENSDVLTKHYRTLDDFLGLRERVERFEI
jgi:signal peptidase I